ncbi:MAG TPA: aldo/keto reductase [Ilumatobacteraceae bacterium]|nr:aldo/keto reductase [Ilumatobacteraceae bacterium]
MQTRKIGVLDVSVVGLGCNNFGMMIDAERTRAVVGAAIDAGINYFDTAESYGGGQSEEFLGAALAGRRADVLIATKWGHTQGLAEDERNGDPARIRRSLEASLTRLGTEYVDHYQLHRPDPNTPQEDTLGALEELRTEGKIREIGCTYFSADELTDAERAGGAIGVPSYPSVQNQYSLLTRDPESDGVLDVCERSGIAFVPFFPLESGLLTGKYRLGEDLPSGTRLAAWGERASRFIDDDRLRTVAALTALAESRGRSMLELAISWLVSNPLVATVIAGATKPEQVAANVAAAGWNLTPEERAGVDAITGNGPGT